MQEVLTILWENWEKIVATLGAIFAFLAWRGSKMETREKWSQTFAQLMKLAFYSTDDIIIELEGHEIIEKDTWWYKLKRALGGKLEGRVRVYGKIWGAPRVKEEILKRYGAKIYTKPTGHWIEIELELKKPDETFRELNDKIDKILEMLNTIKP